MSTSAAVYQVRSSLTKHNYSKVHNKPKKQLTCYFRTEGAASTTHPQEFAKFYAQFLRAKAVTVFSAS